MTTAIKSEGKNRSKIKGRWKSAFSLSFASMLDNNEGTGFITTMFPIIRSQMGMTLSALGWMAALPKMIAVIFGPFWASVGRKYNRKNVLIFATGLWGIWAIAIGFAQSVWALFLLVAISLIGASASQPLMQELLMDLFDDKERGKAVSIVYGLAGMVMLPMGAVNAWLSTMDSGWRYGFYAAGILSAISGIVIWLFLDDPGRGASDMAMEDVEATRKEEYGLVNFQEVKELFKNKTFVLMLGQRMLSGHLLFLSMGVVYMVDVLGIDLAQANLMIIPFYAGLLLGTFTFGFIADWIHKKAPKYGRIATIQSIQFIYAILALIMLTSNFENTSTYTILFTLMGFFGSANMGVNRPIVASVVKPEWRGTAFALFVSVFEAIAWAIYNIAAGKLGQIFGLKPVFMVVLVGIMLVNTAFITLLYKPYAKDVKALENEMELRRQALITQGAEA